MSLAALKHVLNLMGGARAAHHDSIYFTLLGTPDENLCIYTEIFLQLRRFLQKN